MESNDGPESGQCSPEPNPHAERPYGAVAYINGQLGDFLLQLRGEVVTGCELRSHVSVLPPRSITGEEAEAQRWLAEHAAQLNAFEVRLGEVTYFPNSTVIFISVTIGARELIDVHAALDQGPFRFNEKFDYSPHITLAQGFPESELQGKLALCRERWDAYTGPRTFGVEEIFFVKSVAKDCWINLNSTHLEMASTHERR